MQYALPSLGLHAKPLPLEIALAILRESWTTILGGEEWGNHWDFFRSISLVSREWRNVMIEVALRIVRIGTRGDFAAYKSIIRGEFGVDLDSEDVERVRPSARHFFERSDLYITLTDWTCAALVITFNCDYARIPHYIPIARHIDVTVRELPTTDGHSLPFYPLFQCLTQYRAVNGLCLRWTYTHINRYIFPKDDAVHGVTYLRLVEFPRCTCQNFRHIVPGTGANGAVPLYYPSGRHRTDCFSYLLPTLFPDLRHLHIETPYILKNLQIPLHTTLLTIEAPPIHYLAKLGYFSSLMSWNIVSAVKGGLLKKTDEHGPRKKIVVNCGPNKPAGWEHAFFVCDTHDVDLELCHVYEVPNYESAPWANV